MAKSYSSLLVLPVVLLTFIHPTCSYGLREASVKDLLDDIFVGTAPTLPITTIGQQQQQDVNEAPKPIHTDEMHIIGGADAAFNDYPYFVSVESFGHHRCGGTLIRRDIVLTAAHCDPTGFPFAVTIGNFKAKVIERIVHPEFNSPRVGANDVALLKLDQLVPDNVELAPLAIHSPPEGSWLTVIGMGTTTIDTYSASSTLQKVSLQVLPAAQCSNAYGNFYNDASMLCAAAPGRDSCRGDSGGPLLSDTHQIGLVSFGRKCADTKHPGIYMRVEYFLEWIEETACILSPDTCRSQQDSHSIMVAPLSPPIEPKSTNVTPSRRFQRRRQQRRRRPNVDREEVQNRNRDSVRRKSARTRGRGPSKIR